MKARIQKAPSGQIVSGSALSPDPACLCKHSLQIQYRTFMLICCEAFPPNTTDELNTVTALVSSQNRLSLHILKRQSNRKLTSFRCCLLSATETNTRVTLSRTKIKTSQKKLTDLHFILQDTLGGSVY